MKGFISLLALAGLVLASTLAGAQTRKAPSAARSGVRASTPKTVAKKKKAPVRRSAPPVDPTIGDNVDGEDLAVRRAAVAALGTLNGSVVVADPANGRILSIVNQKLAFKNGFIPCSTIKLVTSLAALSEHVVDRNDFVHISRRVTFDMTTAIAHSNNQYFAVLGDRLGFDRVTRYSQMLGLGEKAGLDIDGEQAGAIPAEPPKWGGMGLLTSFGEGFQVTPLEMTALVSAIANGGTLYYLQYPRTQTEADGFTPQIKRTLELAPSGIEDIKFGMRGAVDYGTAKRANYDPNEHILGKTGTCTDFRSSNHMGWFASFNEGPRPVAVVVMLLGTKTVNGPVASGVAGAVYRGLSEQSWFAVASAEPKRDGLPEVVTSYPHQ